LGVVVCTFLLVIAGGLVTSNDAALAIPDWPLAWGKLIPPLDGGIRFEFAHRMLAALVAILTFVFALKTRRTLAWIAFGAVVAQALLGGVLVRWLDPKALAVAHAVLAQVCFGLVFYVVCGAGGAEAPRGLKPTLHVAVFTTIGLGAAVRHGAIGVMPHIFAAVVAVALIMYTGIQAISNNRPGAVLLGLTFFQVFLGMGAYIMRAATADAPQPMPLTIGFTVAHVAVGALIFGAALTGGVVSA
jgi:cytochrome c oxidase assembly protein subunit 15